MKEIFDYIDDAIPDSRQEWKVEHLLKDIIVIVLFATLSNADDWVEIAIFAENNEDLLKKHIQLKNGIPSHDTLQRVMSSVSPAQLQGLVSRWGEFLSRGEGEGLKRVLNLDGKTMRGSGDKNNEALHVVSAWSKDGGVCFGQKSADGKGHEIRLIKELLDTISIKDQIVTIDAIGAQTEIAEKIVKNKGDYVLAVKENQKNLHDDIKQFFADPHLRETCARINTVEKARGNIETREYWQTADIDWLKSDNKWSGLRSIGMTRNTILASDGKESAEERYFISSLPAGAHPDDTKTFSDSVRGHWAIESMHWHLDVTFREDKNRTLEKTAAENLNIMRKWALSILKLLTLNKKYSLKKKRFALSCNLARHIDKLMAF